MESDQKLSKFVIVKCEFCDKNVEKRISLMGYNHNFCNRKCHGDFKLANPKMCSVEDCQNKRSAKGLCQLHYDLERKKDPKRQADTRRNAKLTAEKIKQRRLEDPLFDAECRQKSRMFSVKYREENLEEMRKKDIKYWEKPKRRYNKAKKSAEKRNIDFHLTLDDYAYLTTKGVPCYYECGSVSAQSGIGLDRKDNSLGYTLDNAVSCCGFCNVTKNAHITSEEMLKIVQLLKELRNNDTIWKSSSSGFNINKGRKALA